MKLATRASMLGGALATVAVLAVPVSGHAAGTMYYLSLGDSYSVGYQPNPVTGGVGGASLGYTAVVAQNKGLQLENFGCGGATTSSILTFPDQYCGVVDALNNPHGYGPAAATDPGPATAGQSQLQAAEAFIAANPNQVALITVSIGGNDVTPCAGASAGNPVNGATDPVTCVGNGVAPIKANVEALVGGLRSALVAADGSKTAKKVPIVGLTYPDVLLGLMVNTGPGGTPPNTPTATPSAGNQTLASESTAAFSLLLNPALKTAYSSVKGKFVDVTKATKAYVPFTKKVSMNIPELGLGTIQVPFSVDQICTLTWYCKFANIHAKDAGYNLIGTLIDKAAKVKL